MTHFSTSLHFFLRRSLIFFLVILWVPDVIGQQLFLKHFTVDEGLPSNEVYQVTEDRAGNLLIATDRGPALYDGYRIAPLALKSEKTSMPVYYIYKNQKGKVYFSGLNGYIFEYSGEGLIHYPYDTKVAAQYKHAGILIANTLSQRNDSLWISYNNDYPTNLEVGTSLVLPGGRIQKWKKPEGLYFDLSNNFHYREFKNLYSSQSRQNIYITWEDGTISRDTINFVWEYSYIRRLYSVKHGPYHFFCLGRKVIVYKDRNKMSEFRFQKNILAFEKLDDSTLGIGFETGGAALYHIQDAKLEMPKEKYLNDLSVTSVYRDKQGGTWFSTMENGLFYGHPAQARFKESTEKIASIQKRSPDVFIGYASGKYERYINGKLQETMRVPLQPGQFLMRFAFQSSGDPVAIINKGYYWYGGGKWTYVSSLNYSLLPIHKNLVYGAGMNWAEFHVYEGFGGRQLQRISLPKPIISSFQDNNNNVWVGTLEGLFVYRGDKLIDYTYQHPAFNDRIMGIHRLPTGWLAVATLSKGLVLQKGERTLHLTLQNGLASSVINTMQVDGNTVYLGTNMGITAVSMQEDARPLIQHFGAEAGMPTLDIHQFTVQDGWLYAKWVSRLVTFSLSGFQKKMTTPRVYLKTVHLNGEPVNVFETGKFKHDQNTIVFTFNSINLASATGQTYSYQLVGFENTVHETKDRVANYTNLPPGKYIFKVSVKGINNKSANSYTYHFRIHPAFWQEKWFPWLVGVCFLSAFFLFFRNRLRVSKEKTQLRLELAESNQRALIQLINPHFISNLLNTVHAAILKQHKMEAASVISRFAKLMRLTMEIGKEKYIPLSSELNLLQEYLALEKLRAPDKFDYSVQIDRNINEAWLRIPGMLIQPFIENAIKHGVMHSVQKGEISLWLRFEGEVLLCDVSDNGIGRENAARINANKAGNHQSSGVAITVDRLMLLHRENKSAYLYQVLEKDPLNKALPGTVVTFSIPFKIIP